jgi:hypothetical protein
LYSRMEFITLIPYMRAASGFAMKYGLRIPINAEVSRTRNTVYSTQLHLDHRPKQLETASDKKTVLS